MEVVLQNQDFRSIEIMENDLRFQKNEVCNSNIIIITHACYSLAGQYRSTYTCE